MNEENISIKNIREFIREKAKDFGASNDKGFNKSYIERNNTKSDAFKNDGAYFGFIHPEEELTGTFHDFSLTIFPTTSDQNWLVCLGIGSGGFKNDYELATYPGVRRLFSKFINEKGYCKSDFTDIETSLPKTIANNLELDEIKNTIKNYTKFLPVCQIVEKPESEEGKRIIAAFVAGYAKLRNWPSNAAHRKAISDALNPYFKNKKINEAEEIERLLIDRKYVVLQGAPGTGKTRTAKEVAEKINAKTFFTQFHAETSFSDFIFGIQPNLNNEQLTYKQSLGIFTKALSYATQNSDEKVILIIDEINRANLSNVLGPIFYLFEHKMDKADVEIEISPDFKIKKLPDNFYVIASMNTADRSLSVVDFALRRRFAWYDLKPTIIDGVSTRLENVKVNKLTNSHDYFFIEDYLKINEIFDWYAHSNDLSLQPGQGYFIARNEEEMKSRIQYEIFPLIKEYLQEGLIRNAKEEFNNYFILRINKSLFS